MTRITINGVKGTGTNLKSKTKKIERPKNHSMALNRNRFNLLIKEVSSFFAGCFVFFGFFFGVIFVAIILLYLLILDLLNFLLPHPSHLILRHNTHYLT